MAYWPEEVRKSMQEQEQAKLAEPFAKLTDDELEKQRVETDKKLVALKLEFPKWQIQTQSPAYTEIRRLEKECECIILELTKRGLPTHKPKPRLPAPIRPVNAARTVTRAPAPPTEIRGSGYIPSDPKPTRMPSRPDDFPGELWPRAVVILSKLIQKFPNQKHLSEFCEHIVVEMTPLYCEAVETGKMKAGSVLNDRSGMEKLLRLLLVANDPGHSSWGLSNQAWDILQKVKAATCWGKLAEAIAEAQRDGTGTRHLRTGVKQAESPHPQNSGKTTTTQSAESKSTDAADPRATVDAYIAKILEETGKKITRSDIWMVAGYSDATEFERFQRNDVRTTESGRSNFLRVLAMKPADFIQTLETRKKAAKGAQQKRAE